MNSRRNLSQPTKTEKNETCVSARQYYHKHHEVRAAPSKWPSSSLEPTNHVNKLFLDPSTGLQTMDVSKTGMRILFNFAKQVT
jgi:hypothetical protein